MSIGVWLISLTIFLRFVRVVACVRILFFMAKYICEHTLYLVYGHLDYFYLLAIVNSVAAKVAV